MTPRPLHGNVWGPFFLVVSSSPFILISEKNPMSKKQPKPAHTARPKPDFDIEQAQEAQRIAAAAHHLDTRWPLASVPSSFLVTAANCALDIPDECFEGLNAVETIAQTSLGLDDLAGLELVRRHMSGLEGELIPMSEALHRLISTYDAQTVPST